MLVHECRVELNGRREAGEAVDRCPSGRRHGGRSYGEAGAQSCSFGDGLRCLELGLIEPHAAREIYWGVLLTRDLEDSTSRSAGYTGVLRNCEQDSSIEQISIANKSN